jgi:ribosomal protein S18 acetylase RimI-like enzyme
MAVITRILLAKPQLRPLNIMRDLPAVANLVEACFASTMDDEGRRFIQQMRRAGQDNAFLRWAVNAVDTVSMPLTGYVWEENGQLIGNVSVIPYRHAKHKYYLIANVAVEQEHRRRGIGRALTLAALEHARANAAQEIWLHVRDDNHGAIELYHSLGFIEQARRTTWQARPDRYAGGQLPGLVVSRRARNDWPVQEAWLRRIYPPVLEWYQPMPWSSLRPGLLAALYRTLQDSEFRHWRLAQGGNLLGVLFWQSSPGQRDRLWAAVPAANGEAALTTLLLNARRSLVWRDKLTLDFPGGEYPEAIQAAGFLPHRTLLWMKVDETRTVE